MNEAILFLTNICKVWLPPLSSGHFKYIFASTTAHQWWSCGVNTFHESDRPGQSLLVRCCDVPIRSAPAGFICGNSFRVQLLRKSRMSYGQFTTDVTVLTYCQQECGVSFERLPAGRPPFCYRYVMWQVVWQPPREAWQNSLKRIFLVLIQGKKCVWFAQLLLFVALNSVPRRERILQWIPSIISQEEIFGEPWLKKQFIHSYIHLSIHPSDCLSTCLFIHPSIHTSIHPIHP